MCKDCFEEELYNFSTYIDFEEFKNNLDNKCSTHKLEILESENERTKGIIDFHIYFRCNSCREKFVLSIPENAWRGYFLTENNAGKYYKNLRNSNRHE